MTLKERLRDYASPRTAELGGLIETWLDRIPKP
jgi:hypothetical protein